MSTYLVTGGAGFIGSNIVERLINEGHSVRVVDNFYSGREENLDFTCDLPVKTYELIKGDIRDISLLRKAVKGVDYILHQAALRSVPKSMDDPAAFNEVNVQGTLNVLMAASEARVKRVVFASSSSVYGLAESFPEKESSYPLPISPYAASKLAGEHYCYVFSRGFGLETAALRYFNVFGPKQSLENRYAVVVPKFIINMLNDEPPPVHGDGSQSRDFTYIDNVVEANILAARAPGASGGVFNVACGQDYTVLALVEQLNKILGKDLKPEFIAHRAGDVQRTLADVSRARKVLGLKTKVNFEQGLKKTVEWFKKNKGRYADTGI